MAEMHADGSGVLFWAVERGETHRRMCSMVVGGRPEGNNVESVVRWWWRQAVLTMASAGRFHGRRCRSAWRHFSVATAARGDLRSALSSGQRFGEEHGDNGKLTDFEAGPDGGWLRRSSMRWPWKRWRATAVAAWHLELTQTRSNAVRERRSKSIWPTQ
jgi:hypothetical protein